MKILICAQQFFPDSIGGSARVAFEQARELVKNGAEVWAIVPKMSVKAKETEVIDGIHIHRYGTGRSHPLGQSFVDVRYSGSVIEEVVQMQKPDAVIIHQPTIGYVCLKRVPHIPRIYMFHASVAKEVQFQGLTGKGGWKRLFSRVFVKWLNYIETKTIVSAGRVLVLSDYSRRLVTKLLPSVQDKTIRIATGVDTQRFKPVENKKAIRALIGIPEDRIVFLTVRRLVPRMGLENLIRAVQIVAHEYADICVYMVGEGPLFDSLTRRVKKCGLEKNMILTGRVKENDLPMFYQAADCFVLSTRAYEGLGIATLEALSSGLPVLGTPIGATKEILRAVDKRLLLESADPEDIARGMIWFIRQGILEQKLSEKARSFVCETYTWNHAGKKLLDEIARYVHGYE